MSHKKGRQCADSCLDLLAIELINYYARQSITPPQAAIDAIDTPKPSICLQNSMNANLNCLGEYICKAGYRVGRQLVERYTADKPRLGETLDVIKFICKEFWNEVFHKQVDNLRTNHRGTYVLKDTDFCWLRRLSAPPGEFSTGNTAELAKDYLHLPCGMIRGALVHLGVDCTVTAEAVGLPNGGHSCDFTVSIKAR